MRCLWLIATGLLGWSMSGCGGGSGNGGPGNGIGNSGPDFTIASGNWDLGVAGGQLAQSGSNISGTLHVTGSPCFDPLADELVVSGTVDDAGTVGRLPLRLSSAPVRGQVFGFVGTWLGPPPVPTLPPPPPPNPVTQLTGGWTITGGSCAGTGGSSPLLTDFGGNYVGTIHGQAANVAIHLSQTGPDAQGFFHASGTFTVTGSPCFASGSITSSTIAGQMNQVTVTTDSGQLAGSGQLSAGPSTVIPKLLSFTFTVHGGSCDGQTIMLGAMGA